MAKDPAVLFYTSDFLTGTMTMSNEQVGKYIKLLCLQHQKGVLKESDMLYICNSYDKEVFDKFVKDGDNFYNLRLRVEAEKRANYSKSRSNNRTKGIENKELKEKETELSYDNHMENENENENINVIKIEKFSFKKSLIDFGFNEQLVNDWLLVRKTKKATNTETAFKNFTLEISKRKCNLNDVLKTMVEKSWSGFKWEWIDNLGKSTFEEKKSIAIKPKEQSDFINS